ncbi:MAG: NAD-dependent epimerase/dehydratase family protein [Ignavibacteria bacterium]|nr:NAD-dependent epimerase/dehydratase family protein [Ignavibacteria bacterium]
MSNSREKCLVLGGGGFIGSHLSDELISNGYDVVVFDKLNFSKKNIVHIKNNLSVLEGDFNNDVDIVKSLKGVDYVFHLVSSTLPASSNKNPIYDVETNLISSLMLLNESINNKVKKIIFISSGGTVYGFPKKIPIKEDHPRQPICSYGIIKKAIEDYLYMYNRLHGLDYTVFRISNPYGERQNPLSIQGAIPVFLRKIAKDEQVEIWGDGSITRDYIYIKDVVKVLVSALKISSENKIFNLGSGVGRSLNELIEVMKKVTGKDIKPKYEEARGLDVPVNVLDISLIKSVQKWEPTTDIETGITITYKYICENY